jgi:hypothetical protein
MVQPEVVLPITHLPELQRTDLWKLGREKGEKERKIRGTCQENITSDFINIDGVLTASKPHYSSDSYSTECFQEVGLLPPQPTQDPEPSS